MMTHKHSSHIKALKIEEHCPIDKKIATTFKSWYYLTQLLLNKNQAKEEKINVETREKK